MKPRCQDCEYYIEGTDGEYGGGTWYVGCCNSIIGSTRPRTQIEALQSFPFYPAPSCFIPNAMGLPGHFYSKPFNGKVDDYYKWLLTAKNWSGDAIELIEPISPQRQP